MEGGQTGSIRATENSVGALWPAAEVDPVEIAEGPVGGVDLVPPAGQVLGDLAVRIAVGDLQRPLEVAQERDVGGRPSNSIPAIGASPAAAMVIPPPWLPPVTMILPGVDQW